MNGRRALQNRKLARAAKRGSTLQSDEANVQQLNLISHKDYRQYCTKCANRPKCNLRKGCEKIKLAKATEKKNLNREVTHA